LQEEGTLRIGESVTAVLDLGSVHAWTFTGTAGDIVSIAMVSPDGELDIYLILLDSDGNVLIEDDDSYGDTNSLISDFELPESGTYTIQAAAFDDNTSGVYELTITEGS
jgi:hypothetical protein